MLQQHAAKVQKYNAATAGETVGLVIPSTAITLSKVIEQPVKAGHWSPRLQVCLPDSYNASRKTGSRKAVILNLTNRSCCNYLHTFFSQLWPIAVLHPQSHRCLMIIGKCAIPHVCWH